jgi:hypothetical protein
MDLTGLGSLFDFGGKLIDKIFPDPQKAQEAKIELFKLQQNGELAVLAAETQLAKGQLDVNLEEAKSANWWVAGWRPACGWVGAAGLAYSAILEPFARFVASVGFGYAGVFPVLDTTITMQILFGLLGLGAMRSYDKKNGTAT